jgi:hypothetical protein
MSKRRPSSAASVLIGDRRVGTIEFSKGDSWFLRDLGVLESHDFKLLLHLGEDPPRL